MQYKHAVVSRYFSAYIASKAVITSVKLHLYCFMLLVKMNKEYLLLYRLETSGARRWSSHSMNLCCLSEMSIPYLPMN